MTKLFKFSLLAALALTTANAAEYTVDPSHTNVGFMVKHLKISKVKGNFGDYTAKIDYDKATNELKVFEATIDVSSINTQNETRDNHLRQADFFDVAKFPNITFKMTKFQKDGSNEGKIYGDLTIKDVTKPIVLDFEYNGESKNMKGVEVVGFSLDSEISRKDFKIAQNYLDVTISDKIDFDIEIEALLK